MITVEDRIAFLKESHLFHGLDDAALRYVAEQLVEVRFAAGDVIFEQGSPADSLFFVYAGRVTIERRKGKQVYTPAYFTAGDYFGEQALFRGSFKRSALAKVGEDSILLSLSYDTLQGLFKKHPKLKLNFEVAVESRRLAQKVRFKWIQPDEVVFFLARKHPVVLWRSLVGPAIAMTLPVFLLLWGGALSVMPAVVLGVIVLIAVVLWALWLYIDWGNDYYIVTNQRVIWLEKVIGFYDSRNESPLSTILSVGVETDVVGRLLDYGDVVVRTFVGRLVFWHVSRPYQAMYMIEELWQRTKKSTLRAEEDAMKKAILAKLGKSVPSQPKPAPATPIVVPSPYKPSLWKILGLKYFSMRSEEGEAIIYHKHWFVLLQKTWLPLIITLALVIIMIMYAVNVAFDPQSALIEPTREGRLHFDPLFCSMPLLILPFVLWTVYQYLDWNNDIFQVTSENIIDIDRKPFGTEERRSAQLENILGIEYQRIGLLGHLFNFGTVYITVGGMKMEFQDVADPATVQQDIDRRRVARMARARQAQIAAERERMAEWIAVYHKSAHEFDSAPPTEKTE